MAQATVPFEYSHRTEDGVLIQNITGWDGDPDHAEVFESEWKQRAQSPEITGAVTLFGDGIDLGKETQAHFAEVWGPAADGVGIDRLAFVSAGIKARAISANVDTQGVDIRVFQSESKAVAWARGE